jgi:hypothetical protein
LYGSLERLRIILTTYAVAKTTPVNVHPKVKLSVAEFE